MNTLDNTQLLELINQTSKKYDSTLRRLAAGQDAPPETSPSEVTNHTLEDDENK